MDGRGLGKKLIMRDTNFILNTPQFGNHHLTDEIF
jgi:hypothetical protein